MAVSSAETASSSEAPAAMRRSINVLIDEEMILPDGAAALVPAPLCAKLLVEVSQQTFEADLVLFGSALVAGGGDEGDGDAGEEEPFEIPMGWRGMRRRVRDGEAW